MRNQQGHLSALGGDNRIVTADFDNQGGGLYASGLLSLDGQRFLNQGAAAGQGGKVGAGRIDFSLAGALANRFGQLESESELHLRAAAIDNSGGSLRALGRSGSTRLVAGGLNNAYGVLESANQDLDLQLGSLANAGGRILHTGNGTFGLDSGQVIRAGGELTTNGLLDIRASEWTNSSVLQAGRLNLDIGTFRQTAEGKLLTVQSFTGRGGDWSNDGLLASDGSLRLELSGGYRGNGRATSLGDFALNAASLDLGNAASLAGGANVTLGAGNLLVNRGRITAAGDLVASAASLNNYGTLGGGGNLRLNALALLNERGLLFSGADMTLRAGDITNLYGDVYSLGRLDIARDDAGNRAASLRNLSGVIESGKDFSLRASLIENRRAVLESKSGLYTAKMEQTACIEGVNAGDCSGKRNAIWTITQRDKTEVTASSAMGQLLAGGDFAIDGGTLNNLSSLIGSGGNLTANLEVLDNQGLETGELETIRVLRTARGGDIGGIDQKSRNFTNLYWYQSANFDPARAGEIPAALNAILSDWSFEYEFPSKGPTPISSGDQSYAAVIQAAGDVTVNASTRIDNGVTRPGYTFVGSGRQVGDSAVGGSGVSVVVPLTSQLPPDLARRQVNPVTLPGFSLPQGDNGLFRLSSRFAEDGNGSAALGAGADRTQGGSGVSVGQQGAGNVAGTWQGQGVRVDGLAGAANVQGQGGSTLGGSLPGVARVQGVPGNATPSASHKYLIETNPALTELKQFLNSDYLLSGLGMNPDDSKKRLGDGLYEQRLIRDAVVARTGQRYIDGLSSDEALFRYLMDNAIAYKDKLQLQLGVGLSAEQMAALTHDIVWLEEVEVNGEKVLAPVVYLAQAEGRLAPNGALIQGRDVKLVSGGDLHNVGTLRARNDLSATADNLDNSGLIEAGKRLDLLAGDSIRNRQGGVIAGRDVSLTALTGDVINERSVTRYDSALDGRTWERSFADSAARVEAANSLNVQAGRDIANLGGVLQSRGDLSLDAGRDVTVAAVEDRQGQTRWNTSRLQSVTQLGAEVSAGRDLNVSAGRDLSAVASALEARRDIALSAGRDVTLAAAANEEHAYSKTRKVTYQEDKVAQQGTRVDAGGDLAINAGQDLRLIASQASAGDEAYLVAGDKLELLAANDSNYYLYDKKKKGDFGRKETRRDEVTDVKAVGSQISSGGDLTLLSGGDQTYQGAKLESGNDLAIVSGGAVTFEAVKDLHQESHEKSKGDLAWQSSKGKGQTDETVRQSQIVAQGNLAIKAVEGLKIDLKHIDQKTVSQTIDAMVQADPQLAWLKEAEQRGDVDWRMVQEVHDSWKYSNSGLGAAPSLAIAIVAAAYLGPVYGAMASNLAIGTINNGGDLGKGLQQATSADSLKGYAIAAATAYLVSPQLDKAFGVSSDNINKVTKGFKLSTVEGIGGFAAYSIAQGFAQSVMQQAAYGGSYIDNLGNAMAGQARNLGMAVGFNFIGDSVKYPDGSPPKIMAHALMGGLLAEASGSDFKTGAAAAGANEAMINLLGKMVGGDQNLELMASQLVGVAAASAVNGDVSLGAEIAKSGTAYNRQLHPDEIKFASDVERVKRYAQENGLSEDTARKELLSTAAMMVDNGWNQALAGTDINAARAAQYLRTELGTGPDSNLFQVTQADYYNERVGLTALFKNKEALTSVLENIALANPASYTRDPANRAEVLNAKGEGSQAGFGLALEGIVSAPSKTALWLMGALTCSSCAERDIQNAWNSVASLPEDIRMKGYLDALHTMQGQGASVVRDNAASSTALGVEVGLAIDGGLAGAGKGVVTDGPKGILTLKDFPDVSTKISQKQLRHIAGTQQLEARGGGGFLNSVSDAQKVLDAYHTGQVKILGRNAQGFPVVKFEGVTGTNVNLGVGITDQATNVFIIKGTKSPSIVPTNPNWSPK
ncbi:Filamentous hemagglutinin [Pseudomonas aeruginosa]|nr:Filamentous hemagglutinin [Pseudomonas aeruginosa]